MLCEKPKSHFGKEPKVHFGKELIYQSSELVSTTQMIEEPIKTHDGLNPYSQLKGKIISDYIQGTCRTKIQFTELYGSASLSYVNNLQHDISSILRYLEKGKTYNLFYMNLKLTPQHYPYIISLQSLLSILNLETKLNSLMSTYIDNYTPLP
tara:strand:- start:375 stop:830 length:456 start_codon:yes stop_codon:yes gene_type:complete